MSVRRLLVTVGAVLSLLLSTVGVAHAKPDVGAAAAPGWASVSAWYGLAEAHWDWTGPGAARNISLKVQDRYCNGSAVYAYFIAIRSNGTKFATSRHRYDHKGCKGGGTTYTGLSITDGYNIAHLVLMLCDDKEVSCRASSVTNRNPYT